MGCASSFGTRVHNILLDYRRVSISHYNTVLQWLGEFTTLKESSRAKHISGKDCNNVV